MIQRYTRDEMGEHWTPQARWTWILEIEKAVAEVQAEIGLIPKEAAQDILKKASFSVTRIEELELVTKHDIIAFVQNVAESVGIHGRFVHYGLTSSDVLDSAISLQIRKAGELLLKELDVLKQKVFTLITEHRGTLCAGRTHGIHAEPTTFGYKLAGYHEELSRNQNRLLRAIEQCSVIKLSGAVGTFSGIPEIVESKVAQKFNCLREPMATQVVPRDRIAELMMSLALLGSGLERLSVELRHLQRTEVNEVREGFGLGQKGSSAMPHKRNPISAENISGLARMLRAYAGAALEDIVLWHERDISHSSVERIVLPDAFILADYMIHRMSGLIENLEIDKDQMRKNLELTQGGIFSSHLLLELVKSGLDRTKAYELVQSLSVRRDGGRKENLLEASKKHSQIASLVSSQKLDEIFSGASHQSAIESRLNRWMTESQT